MVPRTQPTVYMRMEHPSMYERTGAEATCWTDGICSVARSGDFIEDYRGVISMRSEPPDFIGGPPQPPTRELPRNRHERRRDRALAKRGRHG